MGADEAKVAEDLEEVADSWYATIANGQDIMPTIVRIQHVHHVCIVPYLIMRQRIVLSW